MRIHTRGNARLARRRAAERGMTLVEVLITVALLGLLANLLVPSMMGFLLDARAARVISEFAIVRQADVSFTTDHGEPPQPWFAVEEHPDLAPYLPDWIDSYDAGLGLYKIYTRYAPGPPGSVPFRAGYLLWSVEGPYLLEAIEEQYDGPLQVLVPGTIIVLVIEEDA